ncbi:hypothetical protein [Nakamurella lactea]|uniref:hypothetical protein n=1 Tax=Nakamurella lactea TaxID=459515 RepID=UPI0003F6E5AE|nr:hypothetical protein [Nakamurella lactea]
MTTPGDKPRRGGFLSNISSALTPPIITDDDPDKPLVAPTGIKVSSVLIAIAGLLFLYMGINSLATQNSQLDRAVTSYVADVANCTAKVGGIGADAKAPEGADDATTKLADSCKNITTPVPTQEMKDNAISHLQLVSWIVIVIGLASVAISWFLRSGAAWARRSAVGLVIATMILTMFLQVSNLFTMLATLLLVAAVLMCYLGKGGVYFVKTAMRRKAA